MTLLLFVFGFWSAPGLAQIVKSVEAVGMTVSDMDRSIEFFSKVLSFEKISDLQVAGVNMSGCKEFSARACVLRA